MAGVRALVSGRLRTKGRRRWSISVRAAVLGATRGSNSLARGEQIYTREVGATARAAALQGPRGRQRGASRPGMAECETAGVRGGGVLPAARAHTQRLRAPARAARD